MSEAPFDLFGQWFGEAGDSESSDPNAMTVATVGADGRPAARTVLLKEWDEHGFVFYGNLESRKGQDLTAHPYAALLFHWKSLQRQIRIEGKVVQVPAARADAYFATRPRASQLGAWASMQSRPLASRAVFEGRLQDAEAEFAGHTVKRPDFWSGWQVQPDYFEFWQGVDFRLHERQTFKRTPQGWQSGQLYP